MLPILGNIIIGFFVSDIVALAARNKSIGYWGGVAISFIACIILSLLDVPFAVPIAAGLSLILFILLPVSEEAKQRKRDRDYKTAMKLKQADDSRK